MTRRPSKRPAAVDVAEMLAGSPDVYWQSIVDEVNAAGTGVRFAILFNHQAAHLLAWATIARDAAKAKP